MEQFLTKEILYLLLLCGILTTLGVSAINTVQNKVSTNWLVFVVSLLVTFTTVQFEFTKVADVQEFITKLLLVMSFSILFYNYMGKWFVDSVFMKIKLFLSTKLQNSETENDK